MPVKTIIMAKATKSGYSANPGMFMPTYVNPNCRNFPPIKASMFSLHARATLDVPKNYKCYEELEIL